MKKGFRGPGTNGQAFQYPEGHPEKNWGNFSGACLGSGGKIFLELGLTNNANDIYYKHED
jgi:hypothetical protein